MTLRQLVALVRGSTPRAARPQQPTPAQLERMRRSPMLAAGRSAAW